jgi:DNA replication protein DnaC
MKPLKSLIPLTAKRTSTAITRRSFAPSGSSAADQNGAGYRLLPGDGTANVTPPTSCDLCGSGKLICGGMGYVTRERPVGHPEFGKLFRCPNLPQRTDDRRKEMLLHVSNLTDYVDKTFDTFNINNDKMMRKHRASLETAKQKAELYTTNLRSWFVLEGVTGCGKTHLAAAIGNRLIERGIEVIFQTVPDLLDSLRETYQEGNDSQYDELFERMRGIHVLIMDDFGTEAKSAWASEKVFQLLDYRYVRKLPTVITTNLKFSQIPMRLRSRIFDVNSTTRVTIDAPDFRLESSSTWYGSLFGYVRYGKMTFDNFIIDSSLNQEERDNLERTKAACQSFVHAREGWLLLSGGFGSGKTHLAAAVANAAYAHERDVVMVSMPVLVDKLRNSLAEGSNYTFEELYSLLEGIDLLVIEDFTFDNVTTWAREKVFMLLDSRYVSNKPTFVTTALHPNQIDKRMLVRFTDDRICAWHQLIVNPFTFRTRKSKIPEFRGF